MTIQQIGYFIRLAEELNYTYVARLFFITQPTLSRQIVNLENELNVELFVRKHNTVTLTKEGKHFYDRIKPIYQDFVKVIKETQQFSTEPETLIVGVQEEQLISDSLMKGIHKLRAKHPDLQVKILRATTETLFGGLSTGKFDVINMLIYPEKMLAGENLIYHPIQEEATYMAIAKELNESAQEEITKADFKEYLKKYPVILPAIFQDVPGIDPKGFLKYNLGLSDTDELRIIESGTPISVPVQVESQLGISVTNPTNMFATDPAVVLLKIQGTEGSYSKGVLHNKDNESSYVRELLKIMKMDKKTE